MITRRRFLETSCVCGFLLAAPLRTSIAIAANKRPLPEYCSLAAGTNPFDFCDGLSGTSGVVDLDRSLNLEFFHIARILDVRPGVAFCHGNQSAGAWAIPDSVIDNFTQGTVIIGANLLFQELRSHVWGGTAVAGLIAHEFGHIYQYKTGYDKRLAENQATKKLVELHADYLAGYYLGTKKHDGSDFDIKAFVDSIYLSGDTGFNNVEHHGRPLERERVMIQGYKRGLQGPTAMSDVALSGEELVRSL